jgi:hypothetical protein
MTLEVGIGDVIRAWRALEAASEDERRAIARLLCFDLRPQTVSPSAPAPSATKRPSLEPAPPQVPRDAYEIAPINVDAQPIELTPFMQVRDNPEPTFATSLARPVQQTAVSPESLFRPSWTRALSATLTARRANRGALDVRRTIEIFAERRPLRALPRLSRLVSASEVVTVIDSAETMSWFRSDAEELVTRLDNVTRARLTVAESMGVPSLVAAGAVPAVDDDGSGSTSIRIGRAGRVIGLTDLGLGNVWAKTNSVARVEAWIELGRSLRGRGASLVIVTPVPRHRIPSSLLRLATCVHWDRSTRPAVVAQLVKRMP